MGTEFWSHAKEITKQELQRHQLQHKRSLHEFVATGGEKVNWKNQQQARVLREEKKTLRLRLSGIERQIERLLAPTATGMIQISRKWFNQEDEFLCSQIYNMILWD